MSEFMCRNGHLMRSSDKYCPVCGKPVYTMDGMTASALAAQERAEADREDFAEEQQEESEQEEL